MNKKQAIKLLIKVARKELKRLAFDANLAGIARENPMLAKAAAERDRLEEAVAVMEEDYAT